MDTQCKPPKKERKRERSQFSLCNKQLISLKASSPGSSQTNGTISWQIGQWELNTIRFIHSFVRLANQPSRKTCILQVEIYLSLFEHNFKGATSEMERDGDEEKGAVQNPTRWSRLLFSYPSIDEKELILSLESISPFHSSTLSFSSLLHLLLLRRQSVVIKSQYYLLTCSSSSRQTLLLHNWLIGILLFAHRWINSSQIALITWQSCLLIILLVLLLLWIHSFFHFIQIRNTRRRSLNLWILIK